MGSQGAWFWHAIESFLTENESVKNWKVVIIYLKYIIFQPIRLFCNFFFSDDSERGSMMNLTVALRRQQLGRGRLKWSNFPQNFFLSYLTKHGSDFENNREFHECIENILEILRLVDRDANSNTSKWFKS